MTSNQMNIEPAGGRRADAKKYLQIQVLQVQNLQVDENLQVDKKSSS